MDATRRPKRTTSEKACVVTHSVNIIIGPRYSDIQHIPHKLPVTTKHHLWWGASQTPTTPKRYLVVRTATTNCSN
jgi:hypothetical protein